MLQLDYKLFKNQLKQICRIQMSLLNFRNVTGHDREKASAGIKIELK
ncbi:hypothetical protein B14911_17455 [Bacillus sp. NRRL B-14911]|nr:hypothetical protein B14911_17455 [Bacillus sp. NRRL B-14911]